MRAINDVLKLFASEFNMDYCRHFDKIKSTLEYCNGHIKNFKHINFRGGNEPVISEIISKLEEDLKGLHCGDHEQELRKITFFLVLNTDATYKYSLQADQEICHVLDATPQISKFLLLTIVWELKLDKFFYECLAWTPNWFAIQFIESAVTSMKFLEPYDVLDKVENLVTAIFTNVCRADYRKNDLAAKTQVLNKFHDHTMELFRQFYTPDIEKFSDWSKWEFFKYTGFAIRHILKMTLFCFDCVETPLRKKVEEKYEIYEICKDTCRISESDGYSELVEEILRKILMTLLNTLQFNVMLVTIDVFMHWVEVDVTSELTLQADVGSYAYKVMERMAANSKQFGHDVGEHLKFIAIRPKTLEETIKDATIGNILRQMESEEVTNTEKQLWLNELLSRSVILGNEECLDTVLSNAKLLSYDNCIQIIDYVKAVRAEAEDDAEQYSEMIRIILTKALDNFEIKQLTKLILYTIKCFGVTTVTFQNEEFEQRCTGFFNKSTETADVRGLLQLCFENPSYVWQKFFNDACVSLQQGKHFCAVATKVKSLTDLYLFEILTKSLPAKYEDKFYPYLLFEIYDTQLIDRQTFLKSFVYSNVKNLLDSQQYGPLLPVLTTLSMIVHKSKTVPIFGDITAPVLVMIAEIMDQCRWDLVTYSDLSDELVRLSIDCVQLTNNSFLPVATEKVKQWISNKVKMLRPLTQYYFQKYSLSASEPIKTFDEFLRTDDLNDDASIGKFLITNYVRCTTKETEWLARSEVLRPHICDMILLLESLVCDIGENALSNFRHSIMNYANLVKKIILPAIECDTGKTMELGLKVLMIVKNCPVKVYEEIFMNFHTILLDVFEKSMPLDEQKIEEIKIFVNTMKDCKGKEIFLQKIEESVVTNST